MLEVIREVKALGTATLGLTGGEPLLREDLEEMVAAAGPEMATILFTTGHGLDRARAARLARAGLGCVTIGIEEAEAAAHDRTRRERGSFAEAAAAMVACREAGLYAALSTVGTREKLASGGLERVYSLAKDWGARELRILPPAATGGWAGCEGVMLTPEDRAALAQFHAAHNRRRAGPAVAAVGWLESEAMFGCGAGYHHLFIDAAGEVCPCDLAPLSFGSVADEPLARIWDRMAARFPVPRTRCVARSVAAKLVGETLPLARGKSEAITAPPGEDDKLPEVYRRLLGHKKR
jgi:MoaA/NifB/PqqE/SkfB family radical SAM enzyme